VYASTHSKVDGRARIRPKVIGALLSIPELPGFTSQRAGLSAEWTRPVGDFATDLWPSSYLDGVQRFPTEWLVIEQHDYSSTSGSTGISTFLTSDAGWRVAAEHHDWSGRDLGDFMFDEHLNDEGGLTQDLGGQVAEFLVQVQRNHGLRPSTVDLSLTFQWFWGAIREGNSWFYLDGAGIEHPLVRSVITDTSYQVEVRALELRRYLHRRQQVAVVQHDHVVYANSESFESASYETKNEWASFIWTLVSQTIGDGYNAFSRLLGKHVVTGISNGPNPMALDYDNPERAKYPEFLYGIDPSTGDQKSFTSSPDELANYFGKNPNAPHYLTPIYFDPKVLNRYRDEPSKYEVTASQLMCLGLWSVSLGQSTTGLVEIYLGDLGRDVPWQEWPHWKAHNVLPGGTMAEDRFRRDFLAQWAGEPESLESTRESLVQLRKTSTAVLGWPLIRELSGADLLELNRLRLPTTTEQRELLIPVLTLAKAFVDAIDERNLRTFLGKEGDPARSLALIEALVLRLGGDKEIIQPLRTLYRLRSSGGLAHWGGSEVAQVISKLGLDGMTPAEVIEFLARGLRASCDSLESLLSESQKTSKD
jgi:hypothetical protein